MKKQIWILLTLFAAFVFTIGAALTQVIELLPPEGFWSYNQIHEGGGYNPEDFTFDCMFMNGAYESVGNFLDNNHFDIEHGVYSTSADTIFITLTSSTIPERSGLSFNITWKYDAPFLTIFNASTLTNNRLQGEEKLILRETHTGVKENRSWGSIKLEFSD